MSVRRLREQLRLLDSRGGRRVESIWPAVSKGRTDSGASCAGIILDVTIEPRLSSMDPVGSIVAIDARPCGHEAEEDMFRRPDDDANMPAPHDQVAGLRLRDPLKALDPDIEIVGTGVGIGKAGAFVDRMNQVRAIVSGIAAHFRIERRRDHAQAVVGSKCPNRFSPAVRPRARLRGV